MEATIPTQIMVRNIEKVLWVHIILMSCVGAFAEYCLAKGDLGMQVGLSSHLTIISQTLMD